MGLTQCSVPSIFFFLNIFKGIKVQHPSHNQLAHRFCAECLQACVSPVQLDKAIRYVYINQCRGSTLARIYSTTCLKGIETTSDKQQCTRLVLNPWARKMARKTCTIKDPLLLRSQPQPKDHTEVERSKKAEGNEICWGDITLSKNSLWGASFFNSWGLNKEINSTDLLTQDPHTTLPGMSIRESSHECFYYEAWQVTFSVIFMP